MRALVTGASGFLGGRLTEILVERGFTVKALIREAAIPGCRRFSAGVDVIKGSLADKAVLAVAAENTTHIFHCAAKSTDWAKWRDYYESNVEGTKNLLKAAAASRTLERFLHISTTDVYGYPEVPCDETGPIVDAGLPYNQTKIQGEEAVRKSNLPWTIVRPATIYGPGSVTFGSDIAKLLRQRLMAVVDGGRATGGFLYVDNAIDAILKSAISPNTISRIYNLSDATNATWRTFVDTLADFLKIPRPRIDLPSGLALALARAMEAPHRIGIPGRPLLTRHAVLLLARDQEFPIERARRELGFEPKISFEDGMNRMAKWLASISAA